MIVSRVIPFAHSLLEKATTHGDTAIDATVGNGNDTALLARLVGENGQVFGFDIQTQALETAKTRLVEQQLDNRVHFVQKSHHLALDVIPTTCYGKISSAIFNLGYLPGGDKQITTQAESTITAIKDILSILKPNGIIVIVIYHGHPEGKLERDALLDYFKTIEQKHAVVQYQFLNNKNNPPFVVAIEKGNN